MKVNSQQTHDRAEAAFKKQEIRLREGQKAMAEYHAERLAISDRTARLKTLRLARDAADNPADDSPLAAVSPALDAGRRLRVDGCGSSPFPDSSSRSRVGPPSG